MKNSIIAILMLFCGNSFACEGEAQFTAMIVKNENCVVQLDEFSHFRQHVFCPLAQSEVENLGVHLTERQCEVARVGTGLSGVLFIVDGQIFLD
ncbi:MAG: hypothetical protein HN509_12730 [Halobacteriovoraceae bacterium]|jgi:hypothetical protein|nr:hypothetical protein [Halobacteriovoraceae bacterium]MBT5092675.1 hypothetical protein [Halobacteriovoraceae bacterium]